MCGALQRVPMDWERRRDWAIISAYLKYTNKNYPHKAVTDQTRVAGRKRNVGFGLIELADGVVAFASVWHRRYTHFRAEMMIVHSNIISERVRCMVCVCVTVCAPHTAEHSKESFSRSLSLALPARTRRKHYNHSQWHRTVLQPLCQSVRDTLHMLLSNVGRGFPRWDTRIAIQIQLPSNVATSNAQVTPLRVHDISVPGLKTPSPSSNCVMAVHCSAATQPNTRLAHTQLAFNTLSSRHTAPP